MKNVTISLKENVAKFARVFAARQSKSLSRFINDYLEGLMQAETQRNIAMQDYFSKKTYFDSKGKKYSREELYDREVFRRH